MTSCIRHAPECKFVAVRQDYLLICDGDDCAAAILNELEGWTTYKREQMEADASKDEWVYLSAAQLKADLFGLYGDTRIDTATRSLLRCGYVERRHNPLRPFDRTWQYRLCIGVVQAAVDGTTDQIAHSLKLRNASAQNQEMHVLEIENAFLRNAESSSKTLDSKTQTPRPKTASAEDARAHEGENADFSQVGAG